MHDLRQALSRLHETHNELVRHVNRISSYQAEEMQKKQIEALKEIIAHSELLRFKSFYAARSSVISEIERGNVERYPQDVSGNGYVVKRNRRC